MFKNQELQGISPHVSDRVSNKVPPPRPAFVPHLYYSTSSSSHAAHSPTYTVSQVPLSSPSRLSPPLPYLYFPLKCPTPSTLHHTSPDSPPPTPTSSIYNPSATPLSNVSCYLQPVLAGTTTS